MIAKRISAAKKRFLQHLRQCGVIGTAAARARIGRSVVYEWRHLDADFAAKWDEAIELAYDDLEAGILERAKNGSDTLAIFVAKARWPSKYRERFELNIRNNPEVRAMVSGMAQVLREFVPRDRLEAAINRFLTLVGYQRNTLTADGLAGSAIPGGIATVTERTAPNHGSQTNQTGT